MKLVSGATLVRAVVAAGIALSAGAATAQTKIGALYPFSGGLALLGDESFDTPEVEDIVKDIEAMEQDLPPLKATRRLR